MLRTGIWPAADRFGHQSRNLTVAKLDVAELCSFIAIPSWHWPDAGNDWRAIVNEDQNEFVCLGHSPHA